MNYKFKVGDVVKIVSSGEGFGHSKVGKTVTITALGKYCARNGYRVTPELGNKLKNDYKGFNGEDSFELINVTSWKDKFTRLK